MSAALVLGWRRCVGVGLALGNQGLFIEELLSHWIIADGAVVLAFLADVLKPAAFHLCPARGSSLSFVRLIFKRLIFKRLKLV
ncbi:hypothetical protein T492DRAFT_856676 [Pavlovales sp. CCMP2436]|nr:hypothetical protein T492DRAFT_856676 [Pavlovales sp. CCMP2436]